MLSGKIQHLNQFLRQSYLCKMFQGLGVTPELKHPLVFFLPLCFCQPECSLTLKKHYISHARSRRQVYLRASSPAGSGRKQCGEFIMQMISVGICSASSYRTTWPNLWCRFKKLFTWMDECILHTCRHAHTETHTCTWEGIQSSNSTLSEQASLPEPDPEASYEVKIP